MSEHAVLVHMPLRIGDLVDLDELGEQLVLRLEEANVGEYDGEMVGDDLAVIYLYGPSADRVWKAIERVIRDASLPEGAYVVLRFGPPGSRERRVEL